MSAVAPVAIDRTDRLALGVVGWAGVPQAGAQLVHRLAEGAGQPWEAAGAEHEGDRGEDDDELRTSELHGDDGAASWMRRR